MGPLAPVHSDTAARSFAARSLPPAPIPHPRRLRASLHAELALLPGLAGPGALDRFADELLEAALRVASERALPARRPRPTVGPSMPGFRPRKAIALLAQHGRVEEASWLAFLTALVGSAPAGPLDPRRWAALRALYGGFGEGALGWRAVSARPDALAELCERHADEHAALAEHLGGRDVGAAARAYVRLVAAHGGRQAALFRLGDEPGDRFAGALAALAALPCMDRARSWDLLALLANLRVQPLAPARLHLAPADASTDAAALLLEARPARPGETAALDARATALAMRHGVDLQVLERALRRLAA